MNNPEGSPETNKIIVKSDTKNNFNMSKANLGATDTALRRNESKTSVLVKNVYSL